MTPFTCWKTAWMPQKHPPETTAVCWPGAVARAASCAGAGTGPDELGLALALQAVLPSSAAKRIRAKRMEDFLLYSTKLVGLSDWSHERDKSFKVGPHED